MDGSLCPEVEDVNIVFTLKTDNRNKTEESFDVKILKSLFLTAEQAKRAAQISAGDRLKV